MLCANDAHGRQSISCRYAWFRQTNYWFTVTGTIFDRLTWYKRFYELLDATRPNEAATYHLQIAQYFADA